MIANPRQTRLFMERREMNRMKTLLMIGAICTSPVALAGGSQTCTADFTGDGSLDFFDVSAFLVGFQSQDLISDLNNDGLFNFFDVSAFLIAYQDGCDLVDSDNDRIPDLYETNDGVYINEKATGSDPFDADTDDDGIRDGDEVLGTIDGLDLPAMGANPVRRTIFVEVDWNEGFVEGEERNFRPTEAGVQRIVDCFADAPVENPYGGAPGIDIIIDYGQGGAFTGGAALPGDPSVSIQFDNEFNFIKSIFFDSNRNGYFHYCLSANRYNAPDNGSSGIAELNGDDFMVTLAGFYSDYNFSQTFVHEIGHNLGLRHGGFENRNWKPNYNSVMNYRFQFPGKDIDADTIGDGVLDYSTGDYFNINEASVREIDGVAGIGVDFNGNSVLEPLSYQANLNCFAVYAAPCATMDGCDDDTCDVLQDSNDWENLNYFGITQSTDRRPEAVEIVECDNPPSTR